jgi:hypothetical protein
MDDLHKKYHITTTTVELGAQIEEAARKAVLALAMDGMNQHGLMRPLAQGLLQGWLQVASLEHERIEMAEGLRRMADAVEQSARGA